MSRRRAGYKNTYFYCPGCNKKKLWSQSIHDPTMFTPSQLRRVWVCDHCGNEISVSGRDAEIADHGTVLDRMISDDPPVITYILANYHHVRRPGLKAIYTGNHLDVVRLTDNTGTGIYAIFKFDQENDQELRKLLTTGPTAHVKFRDVPFRRLFWLKRTCLFHKTMRPEAFYGPLFSDREESSYLIAMLLDWAQTLDCNFPELVEEMRTKSEIWFQKENELKEAVEKAADGYIHVEAYDHIKDVVHFRTHPVMTAAEILAMAKAFEQAHRKSQDSASG